MAMCIRALYEAFPRIKAFGCCHEVFSTQKLLCGMLGIDAERRGEIAINVFGVNHFTWIDKASHKGLDLLPLYREFAQKHLEGGYSKNGDDNWMNSHFSCAHRVKFDLFLRYGVIAAAGDRHLAEFMPSSCYLKDPDTARSWKFSLTPVDWREQDLAERLKKSHGLVSGQVPVELESTGEEGHLLIKALLGMGDIVSNVNIPNRGQIPQLPLGAAVETNALFRRDYIGPVLTEKIPENILPLLLPHAANQDTVLKAALNCDRKLALNAFMADPLVNIPPKDAESLFSEMVENTIDYLPNGWRD
jgi:alpha-galactosidase